MALFTNPWFYFILSIILFFGGKFLQAKTLEKQDDINRRQALIKNVKKTIRKLNENDAGVTVYLYDIEIFYRGSKCQAKAESSFLYNIGDYVKYKIVNRKIIFDNILEEEERVDEDKKFWPHRILYILGIISAIVGCLFSLAEGSKLELCLSLIIMGIILAGTAYFLLKPSYKPFKVFEDKKKNGTIEVIKGEVICFDRQQEIISSYSEPKYKVIIRYKTPDGKEVIDKSSFFVSESWKHDIGDIIDLNYDYSTHKVSLVDAPIRSKTPVSTQFALFIISIFFIIFCAIMSNVFQSFL